MRIVFAGTPDFAVPCLDHLLAVGHSIAAVYTQPDRPAGRGRQLRASPVKERALAANLPVLQPQNLRDPGIQAELAAFQPDVMIVVAYGLILPASVLIIPPLGCINVHASLLPCWRGAAPIQRALLNGDSETGVSIMQMEAGLDTGPVFTLASCKIPRGMTGGELHDQLAILGAETLIKQLPAIATGGIVAQPQDNSKANYAEKLSKAEAELDWTTSAIELERKVLAFNPWPVAQTRADSNTLRIWRAQACEAKNYIQPDNAQPGQVLRENNDGIYVATGAGELCLTEIQLPGKRAIKAADFLNAQRSLAGVILGSRATQFI